MVNQGQDAVYEWGGPDRFCLNGEATTGPTYCRPFSRSKRALLLPWMATQRQNQADPSHILSLLTDHLKLNSEACPATYHSRNRRSLVWALREAVGQAWHLKPAGQRGERVVFPWALLRR